MCVCEMSEESTNLLSLPRRHTLSHVLSATVCSNKILDWQYNLFPFIRFEKLEATLVEIPAERARRSKVEGVRSMIASNAHLNAACASKR